MVRKAAFAIQPGDCWSEWIVFPPNSYYLNVNSHASGKIFVKDETGRIFTEGPGESPQIVGIPKKISIQNLEGKTVIYTLNFL